MSEFERTINASDLIDWIMEAYPDWCVGAVRSIVDHVEEMPSAQPEIIHCRECEYGEKDDDGRYFCRDLCCQMGDVWGNVFCSDAERRTDED